MRAAHLRVARPTDHPQDTLRFYRDGLGFEVLSSFTGHDGFDGVMLGHADLPYHFELTWGHPAGSAPSQDNLLVFYLAERDVWIVATERMKQHGFLPVRAFNPYWDRDGVTFEDADGYRVVLQNATWTP